MARTEGPWPKSCVLVAHLLWTMCLFLPCLWFSSVVFRASKTNSALFSRIPCLGLSRTPYSRLQRPCLRAFPQAAKASRILLGFWFGVILLCCLFFKFQQARCAMFHMDSDSISFFKMLHCNIDHFEVGKMQSCVSL